SELADELRARNVPFELEDNGTTVSVRMPREDARLLRNQIAQDGLPSGGVIGMEIFDSSSVTLTESERAIMYQRALQGELARTIASLPEVKTAKVHLAMPQKTLLARDVSDPSASVYVSLKKGRSLSEREAAGMANLVANSVPDLVTERIVIMDGHGTLLWGQNNGEARKILDLKEKREEQLQTKILELLAKPVGRGHVIAQVNVDMDTTSVEERLEQYDADNTALRTEQKTTERVETERNRPTNVAGAQANLPQAPDIEAPKQLGEKSDSNKSIDRKEFAVPKTVRQVSKPLGDIQRLSISVLIDDNPFTAPPAAPAGEEGEDGAVDVPEGVENPGTELAAPLPRPNPEMLASLIKNAVGFNAARGDSIEISFVPFVKPDTVGGDEVQYVESPLELWLWVLITFLIGTAMVVASLWVTEKRRKEAAIADYAQQLQEKEAQIQAQKEEEEGAVPSSTKLRQEVRELTTKNVAATVEVMKGWLRPTLGRN
ncbi:MAG: flagellar basal-body MS-ring/collar protein FliF, partial [Myxococcota bacterium]